MLSLIRLNTKLNFKFHNGTERFVLKLLVKNTCITFVVFRLHALTLSHLTQNILINDRPIREITYEQIVMQI
jgi:hypothetical protein